MVAEKIMKNGLSLVLTGLLSACATTRPVLYPNEHLNTVGMQVADQDIASCISMAKAAGAETDRAREAANQSAKGAVIGGATGSAVGAVLGNLGKGAATGAAGGAAGGLTRSLLDEKPDPVFQNFVDRCLRDKGYDPVGWR